nr:transposase [Streptomyces sp. SAI-041]
MPPARSAPSPPTPRPAHSALVDRELYVPKSWTGDCARCRAATIPVERGFATKPELARAMVLRAPASPLSIAWVTVDAAGRWPGARTSVGELQPVARRYSHGPGTPRPSCR